MDDLKKRSMIFRLKALRIQLVESVKSLDTPDKDFPDHFPSFEFFKCLIAMIEKLDVEIEALEKKIAFMG